MKQLAEAEDPELAAIVARADRRDAEIIEASGLAAEFEDDVQTVGEGAGTRIIHVPVLAEDAQPMSKRQMRIAKDARRSTKDAPVYLKMANDRAMRKRAAEADVGRARGILVFGLMPGPVPLDEWHARSAAVKAASDAEAAEVRQRFIDTTATDKGAEK